MRPSELGDGRTLAHWYVYRGGEGPLGPWTTEVIAEGILTGTLAPDAWVAAPGGAKWLRASEVPVIARLLDGQPTRRGGGAAVLPDTHRTPAAPVPREVEIIVAPSRPASDDAVTPEAPYYGGGDTLESPGNDRRRR